MLCLPMSFDAEPVGAVLLHGVAREVLQRGDLRLLSVLFDGDPQRRQLASRHVDDDLERRRLSDEFFRAGDLDRRSGHAAGPEKRAAGSEGQHGNKSDEETHGSMIRVGPPF
jgi:hypothetical protein